MRTPSLIALLLASSTLIGCGEKDEDSAATDDSVATDDSASDDSGSAEATAQLRAIHLSPDAPNVDIFVNENTEPVARNVAFSDGTGYLEVPAGTYDIKLAVAGEGYENAFTLAAGLELAADIAYTAVAYKPLAEIEPIALVDNAEGLAETDIRIQVVHAASAVGEVDIYEISNPAAPALLLEDVPLGASATLPDLPAGAYVIGLDVNDDGVHDVRYDLPELGGSTWVNLFATNGDDGVPFLIAQLPDGNTPEVGITAEAWLRVLHLGPDAPGVDVFIEGVPGAVVTDLGFKAGTGYVPVPAASLNIDVSATGSGPEDAVLEVDGLALDAGMAYTAVAYGELANISALALADDATGLDGSDIRIQISHTAPAVGEVDIWAITSSGAIPLIEDVPFGASAVLDDLPAGAYTVGLDVNNDATPDVVFNLPELTGGTMVNAFAVNDAQGNVSLIAQLPSSDIAEVLPAN